MPPKRKPSLKSSLVEKKLKKALAFLNRGNTSKAISVVNEVAAGKYRDTETDCQIARILFKAGDTGRAVEYLKKINAEDGADERILMQLASFYKALGNLNEAVYLYNAVIRLNAGNHAAELEYAIIHSMRGNYPHAIDHLTRCKELLEKQPAGKQIAEDTVRCFRSLALCYTSTGDFEKAFLYYNKALSMSDDIDTRTGLANLHEKSGDNKAALQVLSGFNDRELANVGSALVYARLLATHRDSDRCIKILKAALSKTNNPQEVYALKLQLGKVFESISDYDNAFDAFRSGNNALPRSYQKTRQEAYFNSIQSVFTDIKLKSTHPEQRAIFIIGMPRSGTSLVEQVLSAHNYIDAGGEQIYFHDLTSYISKLKGRAYPDCIRDLDATDLVKLSNAYTEYLDSRTSNKRYTDKLPHNFLNIGLINLIAPYSQIIHCKRNPIDTCLSCYTNEFSGVHSYAHRLDDLAHYYSQYERLVDFWRSTLGIRWIDIQYETLVSDTENTVRGLIDFLDLDWDESCLSFYKSGRAVVTASYAQANKPVYKTSVNRWMMYRKHLGPLLELDNNP